MMKLIFIFSKKFRVGVTIWDPIFLNDSEIYSQYRAKVCNYGTNCAGVCTRMKGHSVQLCDKVRISVKEIV
jgi:hypothetical protein